MCAAERLWSWASGCSCRASLTLGPQTHSTTCRSDSNGCTTTSTPTRSTGVCHSGDAPLHAAAQMPWVSPACCVQAGCHPASERECGCACVRPANSAALGPSGMFVCVGAGAGSACHVPPLHATAHREQHTNQVRNMSCACVNTPATSVLTCLQACIVCAIVQRVGDVPAGAMCGRAAVGGRVPLTRWQHCHRSLHAGCVAVHCTGGVGGCCRGGVGVGCRPCLPCTVITPQP